MQQFSRGKKEESWRRNVLWFRSCEQQIEQFQGDSKDTI